MSVSIALICEGSSDPRTVCPLADRMIAGAVDWITADVIDDYRHFRGFRATDPYMTWFDIHDLAREHGVKSLGHFEGLPLHGDGHNTRRALVLLTLHASEESPVEAIIIYRDGDREYEARREAIRKVRDNTPLSIPVVVGVANRMRECWVLNGFDPDPAYPDEQARLDAERERLGFDPRTRAGGLTSEERCPKRVLRALIGDNPDRERACVEKTPIETLCQRGADTGLKDFIDELGRRLIPVFQ
jgi:hypothetical protein